ncbi:MAG: radical SAM protein [Candidatus Methanofastidiosia archaeon]
MFKIVVIFEHFKAVSKWSTWAKVKRLMVYIYMGVKRYTTTGDPMITKGCQLCLQGAKMVLFVTGLCRFRCWYCPLSVNRWQKDVVYANERLITTDEDVIKEAALMDALGTGITGGDPLIRLDRTLHYAALLKDEFSYHHIHMYTASYVDDTVLSQMEGLIDELRIHLIDFSDVSGVEKALQYTFDVGVEIPMIPSRIKETADLILKLKQVGIDFINLNQLEYTDRNILEIKKRGYTLHTDSGTVKGSESAALALAHTEGVHYCSARDKDALQLKNRFIRRAKNVCKPYEEIQDGLLVKGVITCISHARAQRVKALLLSKVDICESFIAVRGSRVETHWALAEEARAWISEKIGIEKRHPTIDQPLIEYIPVE